TSPTTPPTSSKMPRMITKRFMRLQKKNGPSITPPRSTSAKKWLQTEGGSGTAGGSGGSSGFFGSFRGRGSFAATLGLRWGSGSFADQFRSHDAGNKQLGAMIIEIHGSPFRIGSGNDTKAEHFMFDGLTFLHYLHNALLVHPVHIGFESLGVGAPAATRTPLKQARG